MRIVGRSARGVRGMKLSEGDYVVGMAIANDDMELLTVTEKGLGKKTPISAYRKQSRGGMGIKNYMITEKTGNIVGIKTVNDETDDLILMTEGGIIIRIHIDEIRSCGRVSQGVRLIRAGEDDTVAAIAKIERGLGEETEAEALPETLRERNRRISPRKLKRRKQTKRQKRRKRKNKIYDGKIPRRNCFAAGIFCVFCPQKGRYG